MRRSKTENIVKARQSRNMNRKSGSDVSAGTSPELSRRISIPNETTSTKRNQVVPIDAVQGIEVQTLRLKLSGRLVASPRLHLAGRVSWCIFAALSVLHEQRAHLILFVKNLVTEKNVWPLCSQSETSL